jgi:predicted Zn-dependent protease
MPLPFRPQNPVRRVIAYILLVLVTIAGIFVLRQGHETQAAILREKDRATLAAELTGSLEKAGLKDIQMIAALDDSRLADLASMLQMSPRERLQRLFQSQKPAAYDALSHHFTMLSVRDAALPPQEAFEIIAPQEARLSEASRVEIYHALSAKALTSGDADLAAIIIQHGFDMTRAGLDALQNLVAAFRQADRPVSAYRSTQEWLRHHRDTLAMAEREKAEKLQFDLAMESGHPDEALNACLKSLRGYRDHEPLNEGLLMRAHQAALTASRSKEVLPFMQRFVAEFPEAKLEWWMLSKTAAQNPARASSYREWVRRTADVADRNVLAEDAYFYHLRLAAMGDVSYLDRFYPLANYLNRVEECTQVLQSLPERPDGTSIQVRLARLIAANGKPDHALRLFNEWLRLHPSDDAVRLDLVSVMEETGDRAGAIQRLDEWRARAPENRAVGKKLALYSLRAGHHEKALSLLDELSDEDFDTELISGYEIVAEGLESYASLLRALRLGLERNPRHAGKIYLRMAHVAHHLDSADAALQVMREAVSRLPAKTALRLELGSLLIEGGRLDEALREMSHPSLTGHPGREAVIALATRQRQATIAQTEIRKAEPVRAAAGVENIP